MIHVVKELLSDKARTGDDDGLDHVEVDVPQQRLDTLVVELVQTLLMLTHVSPSLPGYAHLNIANYIDMIKDIFLLTSIFALVTVIQLVTRQTWPVPSAMIKAATSADLPGSVASSILSRWIVSQIGFFRVNFL